MIDMTRGKLLPKLARYALPLMLSALLQQCYTVADGLIIGRLLGPDAFAAVGSAAQLNVFPLNMLLGLSIGFGVPLAQRFGAEDGEGYLRCFGQSMVLMMTAGLLLMLSGVCCAGPLLAALNTPAELYGFAQRYLLALWCGLPACALLNILAAALRAVGDSRTPFMALLASAVINIVLDFICILWLQMNVEGAALATVLSQLTGAIWCLRRVWSTRSIKPTRRHFQLQKPVVRELLRLGIPQMLCHGVTATGELAVQAAVNAHGTSFVTGMIASRRYFSLMNVVGNGLEGALATFVGQNTGADNVRRIRAGVRVTLTTGLIAAAAMACIIMVQAEPMILVFLPNGEAEAIRTGVEALRVEAIFLVFLYLLCEVRAAIQGMGNAVIPMLSGFLVLILRFTVVLTAPHWLGRAGLYFTDGAAWAPTAAMLIVSYCVMIRRREKKQLVSDKNAA